MNSDLCFMRERNCAIKSRTEKQSFYSLFDLLLKINTNNLNRKLLYIQNEKGEEEKNFQYKQK